MLVQDMSALPTSVDTRQDPREPLLMAFVISLPAILWRSVTIFLMMGCWHPERMWTLVSYRWMAYTLWRFFAWSMVFFEFFQLFHYSSLIQEDTVSTCQLPLKPGATIVLPHPLHGGSFLQQCCFLRSVYCPSPFWIFPNPFGVLNIFLFASSQKSS